MMITPTEMERLTIFVAAELKPRMPTWTMRRTKGSSDARRMPFDSP